MPLDEIKKVFIDDLQKINFPITGQVKWDVAKQAILLAQGWDGKTLGENVWSKVIEDVREHLRKQGWDFWDGVHTSADPAWQFAQRHPTDFFGAIFTLSIYH